MASLGASFVFWFLFLLWVIKILIKEINENITLLVYSNRLSVLCWWMLSWQHCHCTASQNCWNLSGPLRNLTLSGKSGLQIQGNPRSSCLYPCPLISDTSNSLSCHYTKSLLSAKPSHGIPYQPGTHGAYKALVPSGPSSPSVLDSSYSLLHCFPVTLFPKHTLRILIIFFPLHTPVHLSFSFLPHLHPPPRPFSSLPSQRLLRMPR